MSSLVYLPLPMMLLSYCLCVELNGILPRIKFLKWIDRRFLRAIQIGYDVHWLRPIYVVSLAGVCTLGTMTIIFRATHHLLLSISVSMAGMIMPFIVLEHLIQKLRRDQEVALTLLFGILKRWASIHPDLIQCLSKACEEPLSPGLRMAIQRLLLSIQRGISIEKAFDELSLAVESPLFKDFVIHLRFFAQSRGDVAKLFESFEVEAYRMQKEKTKSSIESLKYQRMIYFLNGLSVVAYLLLVKQQEAARLFYLETQAGMNLSAWFASMIVFMTWTTTLAGSPKGEYI